MISSQPGTSTKLEAFADVNSFQCLYATFPTLANTLKGPTYLEFNLPRLPNRSTPFQGRSFLLFLGSIPDHSVELLQLRPNTQVIDIFGHKVPHKVRPLC
ncbi:hypothetical protein Tco_1466487 [Tanacetum coccineum]